MLVPAQDLQNDTPFEADVCVIGAGTAGLPLALELDKAGLRVVILEAGDFAVRSLDDVVETDESTSYQGKDGWIRAIGGTSRFWGGRLVEFNTADFEAWPKADAAPWPVDDDTPQGCRPRVAELFGFPQHTFIRSPALPTHSRDDMKNDAGVDLVSPIIVGRKRREFSGLAMAIKASARATLCYNAAVMSFSLANGTGRMETVEARGPAGNSISVKARHFVMACGALQSTRLLLWLNACSDGRVFPSGASLGQNLKDHIGYGAGYVTTYQARFLSLLLGLQRHAGVRRALHFNMPRRSGPDVEHPAAYLNFQVEDSDPEKLARVRISAIGKTDVRQLGELVRRPADMGTALGMAAWALSGTRIRALGAARIAAQIAIEQTPSLANAISLSHTRDAWGVPKMHVRWQPSAQDRANLLACKAFFERYWAGLGLDRACGVAWKGEDFAMDLADLRHPCATIEMGTDPHKSIVDANLTCYAIGNLSVLSTATFPRAGSGNPTLTLIKLAFRLADHIVHKMGRVGHQQPQSYASPGVSAGVAH